MVKLAKYANRVGDQRRHYWKKIWREVWIVQRRLTVDCKVSRIPRTVRLARKGIYIIYGPWLCFRDLPCHFLRSPCGLLEHGDRGDGHSSRMFYIFLSRRRSGFSSGSKLRLLSLQLGWYLAVARYQPRPCGQQGLRPHFFLEIILMFISAIYPSYQWFLKWSVTNEERRTKNELTDRTHTRIVSFISTDRTEKTVIQ